VLKVGATGGSLSVWALNAKDGTRSFAVKIDEATLDEIMDYEDSNGICFESETGILHSFNDALNALRHNPWHLFAPLFVHQDFIDPVLTAVMNLGGEKEVIRWRCELARKIRNKKGSQTSNKFRLIK
jgi:hypothetical protein